MTEETKTQEKHVVEAQPGSDLTKLFIDLQEGVPTDEIESLCMECRKQGHTRFMYTKIPFFREIILSSFNCEHCGNRNNEVQFGGSLNDLGVKYTLNVVDMKSLNRSVVKSEFATISIPELDFEIPPQTQQGSIKTVEGFLMSAIEGLSELQPQRRIYSPEVAQQIDQFIEKLRAYQEGKNFPFTLQLTDPSGNSYISTEIIGANDPNLKQISYMRKTEDFVAMGYNVDQAEIERQEEALRAAGKLPEKQDAKDGTTKAVKQTKDEQEQLLSKLTAFAKRDFEPEITASYIDFSKPIDDKANDQNKSDPTKELMTFESHCYACSALGEVRMCQATIPFFKEIIIMAFSCEVCGHRSSEIKQGGGISERATKITFSVMKPSDINRDIFKSDTTFLEIPEVELELQPGTLGAVYTTVEGMLDKIITHLDENNPFGQGDSATNAQFQVFLAKLNELKEGNKPFTIILDDPLSNCFIYNPHAPKEDPQIKVEIYDRTDEQNDDLGITDMKC